MVVVVLGSGSSNSIGGGSSIISSGGSSSNLERASVHRVQSPHGYISQHRNVPFVEIQAKELTTPTF